MDKKALAESYKELHDAFKGFTDDSRAFMASFKSVLDPNIEETEELNNNEKIH